MHTQARATVPRGRDGGRTELWRKEGEGGRVGMKVKGGGWMRGVRSRNGNSRGSPAHREQQLEMEGRKRLLYVL